MALTDRVLSVSVTVSSSTTLSRLYTPSTTVCRLITFQPTTLKTADWTLEISEFLQNKLKQRNNIHTASNKQHHYYFLKRCVNITLRLRLTSGTNHQEKIKVENSKVFVWEMQAHYSTYNVKLYRHVMHSPSNHGAQEPSIPFLADLTMMSGSGSECRTMAPYSPYSAMMVDLPHVFSVLRHLARLFWNHTYIQYNYNQSIILSCN